VTLLNLSAAAPMSKLTSPSRKSDEELIGEKTLYSVHAIDYTELLV